MESEYTWSSMTIGKLAGALAKAQAAFGKLIADKNVKMKGTSKGGKDYEVNYRYADLADALEACRACLNEHEIAVVQMPASSTRNGIEVTTMLVHSSGEWIRSTPLFMPVSGGAQDVGSAITYARRYSLLAMVGLAPEDDDGRKAQDAAPKSWRGEQQRQTKRADRPEQDDGVGHRCTGRASGIARAIDELVTEISGLMRADKAVVYRSAIKAAEIDLAKYGNAAPARPALLTIEDGKAVKAKLEAKLESCERQPGDDGDDPTDGGAP
jgi:hypothetical protein